MTSNQTPKYKLYEKVCIIYDNKLTVVDIQEVIENKYTNGIGIKTYISYIVRHKLPIFEDNNPIKSMSNMKKVDEQEVYNKKDLTKLLP